MPECDIISLMLYEPCRRKIIALRQEKNWSLDYLAEKTGIDVNILKNIENGLQEITPDVLRKVLDACEYFGI